MIELPSPQLQTISNYLATNFPERSDYPEAVLLEGPAEVTITEWMAPTLGSRPHDPLASADGRVWWSGQRMDRLGYADPSTGELQEFPLPQGANPHGLVEDTEGNIWYTGIGANHIGMLNPSTGDVTTYPIPEADTVPSGARGPHTPIFDKDGTLWFTLQSGMVGRLVPSTGVMTIVATPTAGTYPYGIQVNENNNVWYVDFRGNRIGHVASDTMQITEYELPNPNSRPRRLAITPDNAIWYTDFPRGYIGRFDPATGDVQEWASPSGPQSQPYGIAAIDNVLWYSESGVRNDTLVRFDPEVERFQTFLIPSGGGVIRHMMATDSGNLVLACSAMNRVALVEIE
jgi:virginiamycin B lyase